MAHLIPILQDILPIFRPGNVQVVRSTMLDEGTGQTEGMIRKGAIVGMSDHLCASVMIAKPHTSSAIHHHGEQDTIVYAASGHGSIITNPSLITPPPETSNLAASSAPEPFGRQEPPNLTQQSIPSTSNLPAQYSSNPENATYSLHDPSTAIHPPTGNSNPSIDPPIMTTSLEDATPLVVLSPNPTISPSPFHPPEPISVLTPNFPTGAPPSSFSPAATISRRQRGLHKHALAPGDFALIPAWTEHQEVNESDEDVVWIITRSGSKPVVVNLEGWGGKEV